MCGIVALTLNKPNVNISIDSAVALLEHRGPDDSGIWFSENKNVILGHRRLAIVDLSEAGRQPMCNENQTIWLVCNGEIYNYPTLKARLENLGHLFSSNCDSEVIIHAYEQWGVDCAEYLVGMFAFVIWDEKLKRLFAVRDRIGIKPLYYAEISGGIVIASDARALLSLFNQKPEPNPEAIAYIMTIGYVPAPLSIWKTIFKLEPGYHLVWSANEGINLSLYWEPPREIDYQKKYSEDEWDSLFHEVLNDHLLSDVPIGAFLSGGLDSIAMCTGIRNIQRSVKAITVSFPESNKSEEEIAKDVNREIGMSHDIISIKSSDVRRLLNIASEAFDEPIGYSATLTMLTICEHAAQEFKTVLAGDGGDECFGGYVWHRFTPEQSRKFVSKSLTKMRQQIGVVNIPYLKRILKYLYFRKGLPLLQQYSWNLRPRFLPEDAQEIMIDTDLHFDDDKWIAPYAKHFEPKLPLMRALQRIDLMTFCSDCILPKVDRSSMWNSLEVRVPYLDHRIVEWSLRKPVESVETNLSQSKPVLRNYLSRHLAQNLNHLKKQGFSLQIKKNFPIENMIEEIKSSWWVKNGFWNKDWRRITQNAVSPEYGKLWILYILTKWAERWLA